MQTRKTDRKQVAIPGQCCTAQGRVFDIVLSDLTTGGCGFADSEHCLAIGAPVSLMIAGSGPHRAHVRWASDGAVGVSFQAPFAQSDVNGLIEGKAPVVAPAPGPAPAPSPTASVAPPAGSLPLRRVC